MTDWEPATEAEAAMRDALRANDQELYFRILARTDLLLPVSAEALAGQAPMGWGTWTTGGRTHVLAFTSPAALRACLGGSPAPSRRSAYADLAADWPNHEWWLAVNPGLPIEGYLPAWFVSQLSRGDVRLPGRTLGARARLERVESAAKARATAVVPGQDAPVSPAPGPAAVGPLPGAPTTGPADVADTPTTRLTASPLTAPPRPRGGAPAPPHPDGSVGGRPGGPDAAPGGAGDEPVPGGSAWLNVPQRRPSTEAAPGEATVAGNGSPAGVPGPPNQPASFFEPSSGRSRVARGLGEPRRPADRAVPPSRGFAGGQAFPRRRPAPEPLAEQRTHAFQPTSTPTPDPPTVRMTPAGAAPATPPAEAHSPGAAPDEPTRPLRSGGVAPPGVPPRTVPEEPTRAFRAVPPGEEPTRPFRVDGGVAAGEKPTRPSTAAGEATVDLFGQAGGAGAGEPTRPFGVTGVGAADALPRRGPGFGAEQAFPRRRPGPADEEPTRPFPQPPNPVPVEEIVEEVTASIAEPVSGPPAPRRSFSPIVIEGTIIEARDLPVSEPVVPPEATVPAAADPVTAPITLTGSAAADPPVETAEPEATVSLFTPAARPASDPSVGSLFQLVAPTGPEAATGPAAAVRVPEPDVAEPDALQPGAAGPDLPEPDLPEPDVAGPDVPGPAVSAGAIPDPDGGPDPEPAASPAPEFQPANDVEEDLAAAAGTGSTDAFLSTLLLARVLLPVAPDSADGSRPGEPGFVWRTERLDGERYVVVYTSPERMADHVDEPVETVLIKFAQLIRRWPDDAWSFAVNPNTPVGAKLPGEQIVALANWAADVGLGDDVESEPEPQPSAGASPGASRHVPPPVDPSQPVVMQKAVAPSQLSYYLERGYDRVSGFVHRASELAHLNTPAKLHDALGLGHPGSPFSRDAEEIYVLRWPAHRPSLYRIPYGGQNEGAMRAMEGWVIERPPFRGNGFAPGDSSDVVAEFKVDSARLPHGAKLWRIGADGTERVVAVLDTDALLWRRAGED
ncbi:SseB family protein [Micromonospora sp. ATCC 39149]|uniref:SseB family protein n=1 Tax=Micromonospora carbonacea TaxID=47853 RepID=A0A7D5Y9Z0_9ACTN|nr:SseB family protein [Micromonospora sp. ATCC 39149]QLJ98960.1 SseB family protein [Micromonospora carbonacea]